MAHNDFARWSGQWHSVSVPTGRDMQRLDAMSSKLIDGDNGGTWNPTLPIVVGGAGLINDTGGFNGSYEGGVLTSNGGRLLLGDNDWPLLPGTRSKTVVVPLLATRFDAPNAYQLEASTGVGIGLRTPYGVTNSFYPQFGIPSRYMHHNATLSSAVLTVRVQTPVLTVPANLPGFWLSRLSRPRTVLSGGEQLKSTAAGLQLLAAPGTADAYYAAGAAQAITMTCNQNNLVDTTAYSYLLTLQTPSLGFDTNFIFHSLTLNFTNIGDLRFE